MYEAIGIGASMGGLAVLGGILPLLPADYPLPVIVVQHRSHDPADLLADYLGRNCAIAVREAVAKAPVTAPCVYIAPAGYHLLVESDKSFSLSVDAPVCWSIPSIDVLFESCARAYQAGFVGLILSGANSDGAEGLHAVKRHGGLTLVQDPTTAQATEMPNAAIQAVPVDHVMALEELGPFLRELPNALVSEWST